MSTEKLNALQPSMDPKPTGQGTIALGANESRNAANSGRAVDSASARFCRFFPGTVLPLNVQRAASLKLLDETLPRTKVIGLLTQRDETKEDRRRKICTSVGTGCARAQTC